MTVEYGDAEPNGLAEMLGGLIEANLARDPRRRALLSPATITINAPDADVSVTLRVAPGRVFLENGAAQRYDLRVRADSGALLELSSVPLRLGLPDILTREGRAVVGKLIRGEIRVGGLLAHPRKLARFNRLLTVL